MVDKTHKVTDKIAKVVDRAPNVGSKRIVTDKTDKVTDRTSKVADKIAKVMDRAPNVGSKRIVTDKTDKVTDRNTKVLDRTSKVTDKIAKVVDRAAPNVDSPPKISPHNKNATQKLVQRCFLYSNKCS